MLPVHLDLQSGSLNNIDYQPYVEETLVGCQSTFYSTNYTQSCIFKGVWSSKRDTSLEEDTQHLMKKQQFNHSMLKVSRLLEVIFQNSTSGHMLQEIVMTKLPLLTVLVIMEAQDHLIMFLVMIITVSLAQIILMLVMSLGYLLLIHYGMVSNVMSLKLLVVPLPRCHGLQNHYLGTTVIKLR